nr:hypothetical protein Iba_chr07cCG7320 [Ipomoea batatas]
MPSERRKPRLAKAPLTHLVRPSRRPCLWRSLPEALPPLTSMSPIHKAGGVRRKRPSEAPSSKRLSMRGILKQLLSWTGLETKSPAWRRSWNGRLSHTTTDLYCRAKALDNIREKEVEPPKKLEAATAKRAAEEATNRMKDVDSLARFLCQDRAIAKAFFRAFIRTDLGDELVWTYGQARPSLCRADISSSLLFAIIYSAIFLIFVIDHKDQNDRAPYSRDGHLAPIDP